MTDHLRGLKSAGAAFLLVFGIGASCNAENSTESIVRAANNFVATLSDEQRRKVLYDYGDTEQRTRWSNFPTGMVPRGGISFRKMSAAQRAAAMGLLATVLSPRGLEKVNQIRQADDDFKEHGSKAGPPGRALASGPTSGPTSGPEFGRGPPFASGNLFGSDLYYVSFLGKPSTTEPWMLQFGGHHLALNITIAGKRGVLTPTLTGAQPAMFEVNGQTVRPLGRESDKAFALLRVLSEKQRRMAILDYRVADLVLGPGQDDQRIVPEGLKASDMDEKERAMLLDLIGEWANIINETAAAARSAQIKSDLNETWFAWSGPTTGQVGSNITAYYRIQGPHLVIEYAPQHDEPTNHVHTIYRDPTNDYGRQFSPK